MSLKEFCSNLPENKLIDLAIYLIKLGMPTWNKYAETNELDYIDSVVGMHHSVDKNILIDTIYDIESYIHANYLNKRRIKNRLLKRFEQFDDPIVSLQDLDWKLPYEVERIFYSVHNLTLAVNGQTQTVFDESMLYCSINQIIDSIETAGIMNIEEIDIVLMKYT